jgi:hypothetical protein
MELHFESLELGPAGQIFMVRGPMAPKKNVFLNSQKKFTQPQLSKKTPPPAKNFTLLLM